jgi:hypothetical protein
MSAQAREFIDFWIENSVHAAEQSPTPGGSQDAAQLAQRCIDMVKGLGITEAALREEVGDIEEYIRGKLGAANRAERDRLK